MTNLTQDVTINVSVSETYNPKINFTELHNNELYKTDI